MIGLFIACLFWFIDSVIDTYYFGADRLYIENLLRPATIELWGRIQVVSMLMIFSLILMFMLQRHNRIRLTLQNYKLELENIVEQRTSELCIKNSMLEEEICQRQRIEEELVHLATIDTLTSIANRRKFDEALNYEIGRDSRYNNKLSLIFCDLDHFKSINDRYGHKVGDETLKTFARLLSHNIRTTDIFARWGGEEFVLLLPETDVQTAAITAEKLRVIIEDHYFPQVGKISASFGVTEYIETDNESSFIQRADDALYTAKKNGRNRVEVSLPSKKLLKLVSCAPPTSS